MSKPPAFPAPSATPAVPGAGESLNQSRRAFTASVLAMAASAGLAACGGGGGGGSPAPAPGPAPSPAPVPNPVPVPAPAPVVGPGWNQFGRDAQHSATASGAGVIASQALARELWRTPIDLAPQYTSTGGLLAHYGSPVISSRNTVVVPVKTGADSGFRLDARSGANGSLLWQEATDYRVPPHRWFPTCNAVITPANRVYFPGAGGKLLFRDDVDSSGGTAKSVFFYGVSAYTQNKDLFDASVFINTPITVDGAGNLFFGFCVVGPNPAGITGGIARVSAAGEGNWVSAAAAAADASMNKAAMNAAPALSPDGKTLYAAVNNEFVQGARQNGYLVALDAATLARKTSVRLLDPVTNTLAAVIDDSTSSPMVGPDGDVYYGVLESSTQPHNSRGWLLHFDSTLATRKTPGSFGWDNTPSIAPASMVPSYTGASTYLVVSKYNNYTRSGDGDGKNKVALLDPKASQSDPIIPSATVMKEVYTILGPTLQPTADYPGAVYEWCINTAAVDPLTRSVLMNSEDGFLYRWDLVTNSFTERFRLNSGVGQAYTPTALGPDGVVYSVNNATLFAVGK